MKKITLALTILSLIFAVSCHKYTDQGGAWMFQGNTYTVSNCGTVGNSIVASSSGNSNINNFGNISILFAGKSIPATSATYTVVDTLPQAGQVVVSVTTGGVNDTTYSVIGTGGNNQINVTVTKGQVSASGTLEKVYNNLTGVTTNDALVINVHTAGKR